MRPFHADTRLFRLVSPVLSVDRQRQFFIFPIAQDPDDRIRGASKTDRKFGHGRIKALSRMAGPEKLGVHGTDRLGQEQASREVGLSQLTCDDGGLRYGGGPSWKNGSIYSSRFSCPASVAGGDIIESPETPHFETVESRNGSANARV